MSARPPVIVRRATANDAADIARLALAVQDLHASHRPDLFKPGGAERATEIAARMAAKDQLYWVAEHAGRAVGYAYARLVEEPESTWRYAARTLVLDAMGVDEQLRSRGIGRALWDAVRDAAVHEGVARVILNVWSFNTDARRLYERLGFVPFHERMVFELGSETRDR